MSNLNHNFIAGEWLAGASELANINPSDLSDTIGNYAQADSVHNCSAPSMQQRPRNSNGPAPGSSDAITY